MSDLSRSITGKYEKLVTLVEGELFIEYNRKGVSYLLDGVDIHCFFSQYNGKKIQILIQDLSNTSTPNMTDNSKGEWKDG